VLGYGAGIVLLAQQAWQATLRPLENVGKMPLTAYLCGTVMFTTLFYGYTDRSSFFGSLTPVSV
jgi:uncharacterized membrane protein YeiB